MSTPSLVTKRSRPGRSSRRRKRKAQSILDAAASLTLSESKSTSAAVPPDRGITLEGVKVRRREFRVNTTKSESSIVVEEQIDSLDLDDEQKLTSQLGFVPGNAVCIAARLTSEFYKRKGTSNQRLVTEPSVIKLYPITIRDSYDGGKSDGRKFKGRRRGGMRTLDDMETGSDVRCVTNATDKSREEKGTVNHQHDSVKQSSKERCWFIDSSYDSNNQFKRQIIEPFPTLYWLSSPILRSLISQIELSKIQGVQKMEQKLKGSTQYLEQMERAHKSYGQARWELLTEEDKEEVLKRGWGEALDAGRGVAGIRPKRRRFENNNKIIEIWDGVKCLHAHAAHYLAQVEEWKNVNTKKDEACDLKSLMETCKRNDLNLVGKWTMEAVLESMSKQL